MQHPQGGAYRPIKPIRLGLWRPSNPPVAKGIPLAVKTLLGPEHVSHGAWYKPLVRSMTGYGRGQSEAKACRVTVEIRSVNHRFLDLKVRGAAMEASTEEKLRQLVAKSIERGALSVSIRVEYQTVQGELRIDEAAARRAYARLLELGELLGLEGEVSLALVSKQPGVMVGVQTEQDSSEDLSGPIIEAVTIALDELMRMRSNEGTLLKTDLLSRLQRLGELADLLAEHARTAPADIQQRLQERIERLLQNSKIHVDEARLAQEIAIAADKLDVTEELVRVGAHFSQLADLINEDKPVGRRLDFLVQELAREFNTVTSKSQSADVARTVVEAKAELEKIREQVQNIE